MSVEGPAWYCVRTQTKREHIAAGHLRELDGVEVWCPRLRYRKATRRGKIWWLEPMFPGYLMARFDLRELERGVTFCQGVRGLVRFGGQIPEVPADFVDELKRDFDSTDEVITVRIGVEPGDEVEMAHGPLQGQRGTVVAVLSAVERVKVLMDFLGAPQAIDVDVFSLLLPRRPAL